MLRQSWKSQLQVLFVGGLIAMAGTALAQTCAVTEIAKIIAPQPAGTQNKFGASVGIDGDWAIVGAPNNDQLATDAGAAYILHQVNGAWSVAQTIVSPPGTPTPDGDHFGAAVAIQGGLAVVGSTGELVSPTINGGAVHVLAFTGATWEFSQRLTASDAATGDLFGSSVAIDSDCLAIGALGEDDASTNAGSVYVFRNNGAAWAQEQKIPSPNSFGFAEFSQSVSVWGDAIVIGAPGHQQNGFDAGAAYVYRYNSGVWELEATLLAPGGAPNELFGTSVAISGDHVAIGAPKYAANGAAFTYSFDGVSWIGPQTLTLADASSFDTFGASVAMYGDELVVGATGKLIQYPYQPPLGPAVVGAGYLYRLQAGLWMQRFQMRPRFIQTSENDHVPEGQLVGFAAAADSQHVILSAVNFYFVNGPVTGAVLFYPIEPPDCDSNAVPDVCEADCNHNLVADVCEVLDSSAQDCDGNGVPDECDNGTDYVNDAGTANVAWGGGFCPGSGFDLIWLTQFNVVAGGQRLTHIAHPWTGYASSGLPVTALVYDDPNNDGDPSDAVLLATSQTQTINEFGIHAGVTFTTFAVPPVDVGGIGDSFFVGLYASVPCDVFPITVDSGPGPTSTSWLARAPFGQGKINNLAANDTLEHQNVRFMLRAIALDCNGNGVWDQCDIDDRVSVDINRDGIPDECQTTCVADVSPPGDGAVNVNDLLFVIANWGTANGPADINDDGTVNIQDLLTVISAWGPC